MAHNSSTLTRNVEWLPNFIVSGGQTGADRAALDWAICHQIPHGGWCPKGRIATDGPLAHTYRLVETESTGYRQRTKLNVRDIDATLIFNTGALDGGATWEQVVKVFALSKMTAVLLADVQVVDASEKFRGVPVKPLDPVKARDIVMQAYQVVLTRLVQ